MKREKWRKLTVKMGSLLAVMLLLVGICMIYYVFYAYNNVVLANQDAQMLNWVRVLDNNVAETLGGYREQLADVAGRKGMERTLAAFLNEGDSAEFAVRLSENLISRDPLIEAMAVERGGEILISSNGRTDYRLFKQTASSTIYTNNDGKYFLTFREPVESADYIALINLERYYQRLAVTLPVPEDRLILLDYGNSILLHAHNGQIQTEYIGDLDSISYTHKGAQLLIASCESGQTQTASYTVSEKDSETYNVRVAMLPIQQTRNGKLAVALAVSADAILKPLEKGAVQLMFFCALAVLGAFLLIAILIHASLRDRRTEKELQLLREKNTEMEKLTDKTLKLAHHQRLETIGTLTSSIAHEFNNLLTPIMGYSMMTLEKLPPENEELSDNVLEIYNASRKAKMLITRLNELCRKGSENVMDEIGIDSFVRKVMAAAHPGKPKQVQTQMLLNCSENRIYGNDLQLTQMLLNLVLNGFQAMEDREGTLTVETAAEDGMAVIRVKDQGTGIEPAKLNDIFTPFFTTKESGKGTGLGLAIAQQAVESHNGTIEVESTVGQGTVFTVKIPLLTAEPAETAAE